MKCGWIELSIEGLNIERFLTGIAQTAVRIRQLRRLTPRKIRFLIQERDLPAVQVLAAEKGWGVTIGQRRGINRLTARFAKHWVLLLLLLLTACCLMIASQTACRVVIVDGGRYTNDVQQFLVEFGIRFPCRKNAVNLNDLREALEWRYPELARIDCGWRGMTLRISLVRGITEGETFTSNGACHVVASRTGIVDRIITYAGTPVVTPGTLVQTGQLLIKGEERAADETLRAVRASGVVMARVWDGEKIKMPTLETKTIYTGTTMDTLTVTCPFFDLWHAPSAPFEHADVSRSQTPLGGFFFPITIRKETYFEAQQVVHPRELSDVKAEAGIAAMRALRQKIGFDDVLVDKWIEYSIIDDEGLYALAIGERILDIAVSEDAFIP